MMSGDNDDTPEPPVNAEAQARVDSVNAALEELRRTQGLWITGADGRPKWLPPDDFELAESASDDPERITARPREGRG